ncbi:MAG: ATP-dependent nuclease [Litorimonas sp.]
MAKIRFIKIENFRCFESFEWHPNSGLNCLIGSGDSGKSTIIDAIDLALGPRQTKLFSDADFHLLQTDKSILIEITVGDLDDPLKNLEKYDMWLRGYDSAKKAIEDEPAENLETVLTVRLEIGDDLDPQWSLYSARAETQGREKNLSWGDRVLLAGTRIGAVSDYHLSWRKGAVLNRIGDETPNTTSAIAKAKRAARDAFGAEAQPDLNDVLKAVSDTAANLGVPIEGDLQALLNAHSISLNGGTISVHDKNGLPLGSLGLGSSRLLVAGLLDKAKKGSNLILVDELEYGLEPHRIIRFLDAIGAKDETERKQSFVTTHSPIVLRELSASQLFRLCKTGDVHSANSANCDPTSQGTLRLYPEAFLAKSIMLCEGASEVGFLRGLDQYFSTQDKQSFWACGSTLVDASGVSKLYKAAPTLQSLGYRIASLRDDDVLPDIQQEAEFIANGSTVFKWTAGYKIENAIINAAPLDMIEKIINAGISSVGEQTVDEHIKSTSSGKTNLKNFQDLAPLGLISQDDRNILTNACTTKNAWFKSVSSMESLARDIIAPQLADMHADFSSVVTAVGTWMLNE